MGFLLQLGRGAGASSCSLNVQRHEWFANIKAKPYFTGLTVKHNFY